MAKKKEKTIYINDRDGTEMMLEDLYVLTIKENEEEEDKSGRWILHDDDKLELIGIDRPITQILDKLVKKGDLDIRVNRLKKPSKERIKELFHSDAFGTFLSGPRNLLKRKNKEKE